MEKLLTIRELAGSLSLKEKTLYSWVAQRKIPFVKVNGEVRFVERHINGWLEQRTVTAKTA